jgi:hypothetical protein
MESKALDLLEKAICARNDDRGVGGAAKVAVELGTSDSMISQLRGRSYPKRSASKWYLLIIEKYGQETVRCPVIGEISLERCRTERERPYSMANPTRGELSRTCPKCGSKP